MRKRTENQSFFTNDSGRNLVTAIDRYNHWMRIPCFPHSLQLSMKSVLKNLKQFEQTCQQYRNTVTYRCQSTIVREKFKHIKKSVYQDITPLQLVEELDTGIKHYTK